MGLHAADQGRKNNEKTRRTDRGSLAKEGDEKAFARLVDQNFDLVHAICTRTCKDPGLATDAIQDTFVLAWHELDTHRGEAKFSSWLCKVAEQTSRGKLRRQRYASENPD
ncbi:RNA polymerase sigma factor [Corynebacterium pyruviciproducens]|uniref:RNA polymerase sigma factor n=1 Tax=Corynebacterium pyruviciproducens TaxID=598660 RepID=UPI0034E0B482